MKLQDKLPDGVRVDGKFYKMDFDFRNVLRMAEILDSENLMPEAKAYNALHCLCKRPKNVLRVCEAVIGLLFAKGRKNGPKVTDFEQDAGMIRAAFRQAYGIDLYTEKLHWFEFRELLNGLPDNTRYSEVISIRARPIPAPTKYNSQEREWLIKAKAEVALKATENEQKERYEKDVNTIAAFMISMIPKEVKENG